jgi:hypothetical protein
LLNYFSIITAASYAGLIYLGLRFLRKSIMNRGETVECDDERDENRCYLVGEEEAIWLLRLVLPYINEVLLSLRSLFSGEPATTMKVEPSEYCACLNIRQKNTWNVVSGIDWTSLDLY